MRIKHFLALLLSVILVASLAIAPLGIVAETPVDTQQNAELITEVPVTGEQTETPAGEETTPPPTDGLETEVPADGEQTEVPAEE